MILDTEKEIVLVYFTREDLVGLVGDLLDGAELSEQTFAAFKDFIEAANTSLTEQASEYVRDCFGEFQQMFGKIEEGNEED